MNKNRIIILLVFLINVIGYSYLIRRVYVLEHNYSYVKHKANTYEYLFKLCKTLYKGGSRNEVK